MRRNTGRVMLARFYNVQGRRFGKLTVLFGPVRPVDGGPSTWLCRCDCGNGTLARADHLRNGFRKSCGCLRGKWRLGLKGPMSEAQKQAAQATKEKRRPQRLRLLREELALPKEG